MSVQGQSAGSGVGKVTVIAEQNPPRVKVGGPSEPAIPPKGEWDPKAFIPDPKIRDAIPVPERFYVVVALPKINEKTDGGVYLPDSHRDVERSASMIGLVIAKGPDAFNDKSRYPNGSNVELGSWVLMSMYAGTRVQIGDQEFRIITDDTVKAVVTDPMMVGRVK